MGRRQPAHSGVPSAFRSLSVALRVVTSAATIAAEARGIDFVNVREAIHAAHGFGPASEMGGPRGMERHGGPGMPHVVDCPIMSMGASVRAPGGSQN